MTKTHKRCATCKNEYPLANFYKNSQQKDGKSCYCKGCQNKTLKEYKSTHKEQTNAASRRRRKENPEHYRQYNRNYSALPSAKQYAKKWRQQNRDKIQGYYITWKTKDPEGVRARTIRRRSVEKTGNGITGGDIKRQYKSQKGCCYWCGVSVKHGYEIDHVIPLSRGGINSRENIVLACTPCNRSKKDKLPHEWSGSNGKLL